MVLINFILFYNGKESYDNHLVTYNTDTYQWSVSKTNIDTGMLGNFHPAKTYYTVPYDNKNNKKYKFITSENAYQASKSLKESEIVQFCDVYPGYAFKLGRQITLRDDWEAIKVDVMRSIIKEKFSIEELKKQLLATGSIYLIEHTRFKHRDNFWADDHDGSGRNTLGILLMELRGALGGNAIPDIPPEIFVELYKVLPKLRFN